MSKKVSNSNNNGAAKAQNNGNGATTPSTVERTKGFIRRNWKKAAMVIGAAALTGAGYVVGKKFGDSDNDIGFEEEMDVTEDVDIE